LLQGLWPNPHEATNFMEMRSPKMLFSLSVVWYQPNFKNMEIIFINEWPSPISDSKYF
jgi:hypothetical protein